MPRLTHSSRLSPSPCATGGSSTSVRTRLHRRHKSKPALVGKPPVAHGAWLLLLALATTLAAAAEFYVAPDGDDVAPGTQAQPFATLARARDAARERPAGEPATIWLGGGTYPLTSTLTLGAKDSGTAEAPVVWSSVPGEVARLFGGVGLQRKWFAPVTNRAVLDRVISEGARAKLVGCDLNGHGITDYGKLSRHGFYKANLGETPPPELFIDGARMTRARWPNPDDHFPEYLRGEQKSRRGVVGRSAIVDPGPKNGDPDFLERGGTISYAFDRPEQWSQADDIWVDGIFTWSWEWSYNQVAKLDVAKHQLTLRYGEVGSIADRYSNDYFFCENLLEEIDQPGEYYLDRTTGWLYLLPPDGFDQPGVDLSLSLLTTPMIQADGASDVIFRNLLLDSGRSSGIVVKGGRNVLVEHCEIARLSGHAVSLSGQDHGVRACLIHDVGSGGVSLNGGNPTTLEPSGCFVEDSVIDDFAWYSKVYTPAISLGYRSVGDRASHNRLSHGPHLAMVVYGNDHLVEYNDIGHVVEDFTDMGAIYANLGSRPLERGTVIRRNYFHDIGLEHHLQNAVYPDNMTMGWTIEENVFARIGAPGVSNCRAINLNSAADILMRHNLFVDCTIPCMMSSHAGNANYAGTLQAWHDYFAKVDLAKLPHAKRYPELLRFFDEPRQFPKSCVFERNVVYNPQTKLLRYYGRNRLEMKDGTLDEPATLQLRDNWVTDTDPGFSDASAGDYTLRPGAPVFAQIPGFAAVPFDQIGPRVTPGPER